MSNGIRYVKALNPIIVLLLITLPLITSIAPSTPPTDNHYTDANEDIINISDYAYPDPTDASVYRIALFGTNDFHGTIFPIRLYNEVTKDFYESGGAEYLGKYISILRKDWGDRFIWLDAGDQYQGAMEFSISEGKIMNAFYNTKQLNAMGIGNHDFDLGFDALKKNMEESKFDYLVANMFDTVTQSYEFMPKQKKSNMYTVGKVKIGVVGVATLSTPTTTTGFPNTIQMKDHKELITAEAKALRAQGANAVILLSHIGTKCNDSYDVLSKLQMRMKDTAQAECGKDNDEFIKLINSLEPGLFDGIVAGHLHGMNHHWIKNIPTIQSYGGDYAHVMYLSFDPTTLKLIPDQVSIEGPLPACGRIFEKTRLCRYVSKAEAAQAGQMKLFSFHTVLMEKDPELKEPFEQWRKVIEDNQSKYITTTEVQLGTNSYHETTLTNIFNDVGLKISGAHLSFMNLGGFRKQWYPGPLNEIDMYNMSPFHSFYVSFVMTGKEVWRMLQTVQGGTIIYPMGGVNLYCKFDYRKYIKVIDVKLYNGYKEIVLEPDKEYTVVTSDFLANGGSAMARVLKWYTMRGRVDYKVPIREEVTDFLKRIPNIHKDMFIDSNHPRVRFLNQPTSKGANDYDLEDDANDNEMCSNHFCLNDNIE